MRNGSGLLIMFFPYNLLLNIDEKQTKSTNVEGFCLESKFQAGPCKRLLIHNSGKWESGGCRMHPIMTANHFNLSIFFRGKLHFATTTLICNCISSRQLLPSLTVKLIEGLFARKNSYKMIRLQATAHSRLETFTWTFQPEAKRSAQEKLLVPLTNLCLQIY